MEQDLEKINAVFIGSLIATLLIASTCAGVLSGASEVWLGVVEKL